MHTGHHPHGFAATAAITAHTHTAPGQPSFSRIFLLFCIRSWATAAEEEKRRSLYWILVVRLIPLRVNSAHHLNTFAAIPAVVYLHLSPFLRFSFFQRKQHGVSTSFSYPLQRRGERESRGCVFIFLLGRLDKTVKSTMIPSGFAHDGGGRDLAGWERRRKIPGVMMFRIFTNLP